MSGLEEVAPMARNNGKSTTIPTQSLKSIPPRDRCSGSNHVPQIVQQLVFHLDLSIGRSTLPKRDCSGLFLMTVFRASLLLRLEPSVHFMPAEGLP